MPKLILLKEFYIVILIVQAFNYCHIVIAIYSILRINVFFILEDIMLLEFNKDINI